MGRIIPYIMENKIHVCNHQPDLDPRKGFWLGNQDGDKSSTTGKTSFGRQTRILNNLKHAPSQL